MFWLEEKSAARGYDRRLCLSKKMTTKVHILKGKIDRRSARLDDFWENAGIDYATLEIVARKIKSKRRSIQLLLQSNERLVCAGPPAASTRQHGGNGVKFRRTSRSKTRREEEEEEEDGVGVNGSKFSQFREFFFLFFFISWTSITSFGPAL